LDGIPPTPTKLHIESVLLALLLSLPVKSTPLAAIGWMDGFLHEWIADRWMDARVWTGEAWWLDWKGGECPLFGAAVVGLAK